MKKGDLYQSKDQQVLVEVLRTWNHRDIDPECPESVAIVGMLEVVILTGTSMGKKQKYRTRGFRTRFEKISEAS